MSTGERRVSRASARLVTRPLRVSERRQRGRSPAPERMCSATDVNGETLSGLGSVDGIETRVVGRARRRRGHLVRR